MNKKSYIEPQCRKCKFFRQTSEKAFACGKFNLELEPVSRNELRNGCWEKRAGLWILSPNIYGLGINLKILWRKIIKK